MDLHDLKMFLHLAKSRHLGRSTQVMHVNPSTLSRQIQRLEEDLGQPLFVRDNRTVALAEAGEKLRVSVQQALLQYQQLRHTLDRQGPPLSGELHIFCLVAAAYSHLPPILDHSCAEHPSVKIKLTTGDAADAMDKVVAGEADLAIADKPETLPDAVASSILENLTVVLIVPALPCPVHNQVSVDKPDWLTVPFIMVGRGPIRRRIELWFRRHKISNPSIYVTVGSHEAVVSMMALGCGTALLPKVVLENSPEPVRNRMMILERSGEKTPFELGVYAPKKRLHEPLINAFWKIVLGHKSAEQRQRQVQNQWQI